MALPIYNQPSMQWQIYNDPSNLVYQAGLDFTTYGAYTFGASGTVQQSVIQTQVSADGVGIDNTTNMNPVTVSVGNLFTESVPAFTKALIILGQSSSTVMITSIGGQAKATFYKGTYPGSIAQTNILGATKQAIAVYLPPGTVTMFAGLSGNIPDGYLLCQGQAVSRISYSALFAAIGTIYGAGDGASTFNIPNMVGNVVMGATTATGGTYPIGSYGGEITHTLNTNEIPSHQHYSYVDQNAGYTVTGGTGGAFQYAPLSSGGYNQTNMGNIVTSWAGGLNNTGRAPTATVPHNNLQPYVTMNFIIKT